MQSGFRKAVLGSVAAAALAWSAASSALTISDTVVPGFNFWSDNNAEIIINRAGSATTIDQGDFLVTALGFNQYNGTPGTGVTNEATALIILEVTSVTPTLSGNCGGAPSCATYTFAAPGIGFNAAAALIGLGGFTDANGGALAAGTIGLVFFDVLKDFLIGYPDLAPNLATIFAAALNGTVEATLGLNSITGSAPADLTDISSLNNIILPGQGAGGFQFDLSVLTQSFPGFTIVGSLTGSSNILEPALGPLVNVGIRTDTTVFFNAVRVPEPGTVVLLGVGLIGLALIRRRVS